jgi:septum site-determining protein MinC
VSVMSSSRVSLRLLGRSYLAFVLAPEAPLSDWLAELDSRLPRQSDFFTNRPIIADLSSLIPTASETEEVIGELEKRGLRLVAVEGVDPGWLPSRLAPLPGAPMPAGMFSPDAPAGQTTPRPARFKYDQLSEERKPSSLLLEEPLRSGQSLIYPQGDVTIIGSVASGAEIIAGGSIHVYGTLRGRAFAGSSGNPKARIFCNRFDAELLVIDGLYKTADDFEPQLLGAQVQARLDRDVLNIEAFQ